MSSLPSPSSKIDRSGPDFQALVSQGLDALDILNNVTDSIVVVDRDWRCTYLNRRAQNVLGKHALVDGNLWAMFPKLAASRTGLALRRAMAEAVATEAEDMLPQTGEWFSSNAYPLDDGLAIFFRRITDRKQAQETIASSERRFRAMFDTLTQGVIFQDVTGKIVEANPAAERILGLPRADLLGRTARDAIWQPCDEDGIPFRDVSYPGQAALISKETISNVIIGIFNPTLKQRRWIRVDVIPQFDEDSSPKQVCSIFDDITEQRQAQLELRDSQAHLALAQRVASVGSASIDFRTNTWTWSDETYRIYGVDRNAYSPSLDDIGRLIHPDDLLTFIEGVETARRGIVPYPLEYRVVRPDGEVRVIYREADLLYDKAGTVIGAIATKRDVTELRAAERQKDTLRNQLYHAQRMDALGTLAGGIAHDLNNTLVPILGLSEAILNSLPEADPKRPLVDLIYKAGARARDLVRQILTFSRRDSPNSQQIDLREFFIETMRLARASVPSTITIRQRISQVPPIFGDASQLHQVVLNLIANSTHAIGETTGTISVDVTRSGSNKLDKRRKISDAFVRISVLDTGCGMDEEIQKRIFEPFFTTKKVGVGTGLGLAVVHGIVVAHGGHIEITSKIGRGTRFDIYLPALSKAQLPDPNGKAV